MESIGKILSRVRRSYDRSGEHYDRETDLFNARVAYPRLIEMLENATGPIRGKRILDVGCGSGRLMTLLDTRGAQTAGVDISQAYTDRARSRGLDVQCASMLRLPFPELSFDAVVSYFSLDYVPRKEKVRVLREQYRILRSGGTVVLVCWHAKAETPERITLPLLGEEFVLYPEQQEVIAEIMTESGFNGCHISASKCTDEEVGDILAATNNPGLRAFMEKFRHEPYAVTVVAKKV